MNDIFSDILDVCVIIYLDDILIYLNNMSEHHWHVKEVLKHLCFGIKASLAEMLEYFFYMPVMLRHVIQVDEYIIQIDNDTDIQKVRENIVHELLKGHGSIGKTKEHYKPFK